MAPEQMRGGTTDARTDVFAYCVSLYEALYGTRPYVGKSIEEVRAAAESERLEAPKHLVGPSPYRRALERGLRSDPSLRQGAIDELLAVLRVDPIARRNQRVALALALAAVAGIGGFGAYQHGRLQTCGGAEARLAGVWDAPRKSAVHDALVAGGASDAWPAVEATFDSFAASWVTMSTQACEAARLRGTEPEALFDRRTRCLDDRLSELRAASGVLAEADAKVAPRARKIAATVGELDRCADAAHLLVSDADPPRAADKAEYDRLRDRISQLGALDVAGKREAERALLADIEPQIARMGNLVLESEAEEWRASIAFDQGRIEEAIAGWHQSAATAERARHDRMVAMSWRQLTYATMIQGRLEEALMWARYAEAGSERVGAPASTRAEVVAYRSAILAQLGRTDETLEAGRTVLALCATPPKNESQAFVMQASRGNAIEALSLVGYYEEAITAGRALRDELVKSRGSEHPFAIAALANVASYLALAERFDEAVPLAEEALTMADRSLGPTANETGTAALALGDAEAGLGRLEPATVHLQRALGIFEQSSPGGPSVVYALTRLGEIAQGQKRPDIPELERALALGNEAKLSPLLLAPTRFALARALPAAARERARGLATEARDAYAGSAKVGAEAIARKRDRVEAWLQNN
jgi:tetratricopeptide (TPR) repeat protein